MYYFGSLTKKFKTPGFPGKYFNGALEGKSLQGFLSA